MYPIASLPPHTWYHLLLHLSDIFKKRWFEFISFAPNRKLGRSRCSRKDQDQYLALNIWKLRTRIDINFNLGLVIRNYFSIFIYSTRIFYHRKNGNLIKEQSYIQKLNSSLHFHIKRNTCSVWRLFTASNAF